MFSGFRFELGLLVVLLAQYVGLDAPWRGPVMLATGLAAGLLLTVCIVHPRAQAITPTVWRGGPAARLAFTFDDGPHPEVTPAVLDILREHGAKATFFVVGEQVQRHPELVRRIHAEGHQLGSHSQHHSLRFHFSLAAAMRREILAGIASIAAITGESPRDFRPPQGLRTPPLGRALANLSPPLRCITWTARGKDSLETTAAAIEARLLPALRPGAILTLHDGVGYGGGQDRAPTLQALRTLLRAARARGLSCVRVDALDLPPP